MGTCIDDHIEHLNEEVQHLSLLEHYVVLDLIGDYVL